MKINPWDCKYFESDEYEYEDDWEWVYICNYPSKLNCTLDPKGCEQECEYGEKYETET